MTLKNHVRDEVVALRKAGHTFTEIQKTTGLGKSTIFYILKDVSFSNSEVQALADTKIKNLQNRPKHRDTTKEKLSNIMKAYWEEHEHTEAHRLSSQKNVHAAGLSYRQDELPYKVVLEKLYNTVFCKEYLADCYIDFADDEYLIEVTSDITRGTMEMVLRFEKVAKTQDTRKRIAYTCLTNPEGKWFRRLTAVNVDVKHIDLIRV